nr:scaffold protein involved in DNA repair [Myotis myotis]
MFRFKSLTNNSPESQVLCSLPTLRTDWTHRHCSSQAPLSDSLLDTVESQGAATWSGVGVPVVVQRVYFLPCRCQQGGGSASLPSSDAPSFPSFRVCLLVQDAYGMFGEVHSEGTIFKDRRLEGQSCRLAGMKVLQKAIRGRTAGLFSLIDTLWPPVVPLKAPGHGQACEEANTPLPPRFCYVLTAHPTLGQIDIIEDPVSKLYQPPAPCSLREILQTGDLGTRCSFYARVIYQRPLLSSMLLEQREIWLTVTDVTLQAQDESPSGFPRTLPVCVTSSCVLGQEVLEELAKAAPHSFFFRDALRDQGRLVCGERTVLSLPEPVLDVALGTRSCELPGPVRLDGLDSVTQVNCICSVQGTVVAVDESTAFSWPVCDRCGSQRLEQSPEDSDRGAFSCADCSRVVTSPGLRRHLQVFLACPARPQCTVRVKLMQSSIASILRFAAGEDGGYEVNSVIGKEVGWLNCFVQSITTHPTSCLGLEEIELLGERASSGTTGSPGRL